MKTYIPLTLFVLLFSFYTKAQVFPITDVLINGPDDQMVTLVFMGDGYQSTEMGKYITDVNSYVNHFFSISPFKEYKNYFNVYAIEVPSNESGADHPQTANDEGSSGGQPFADVDTYFNSTFDYAGIHRLLVSQNSFAISNVLAANKPNYDQAFIIVNSSYYGGAGGQYATASTHSNGAEIAIHEIGHSYADLADEYFYIHQEKANQTADNNPTTNKWKNWLGDNGVGIYEHTTAGAYRPHQGCKMRYLGNSYPFCSVCTEKFVKTFHLDTDPILQFLPISNNVTIFSGGQNFSLDLVLPEPNTMSIEWTLDGVVIDPNNIEITLNVNDLNPGVNSLVARVTDLTTYVRTDNYDNVNYYDVQWNVSAGSTSDVLENDDQEDLLIYPNPNNGKFLLKINEKIAKPYTVSVVDMSGRLIYKELYKSNNSVTTIDLQSIVSGVYNIVVSLDDRIIIHRLFIDS